MTDNELLFISVDVIMVFICGFLLGRLVGNKTDEFHDEAVKKGKAEYYLDENNERQWRWKE